MKIRTGFVSNSSSSSYVLPKSFYKSSFNVAKRMIPHRGWEDEDKKLLEIVKDFEKDGKNPNPPISFSTCNYDTYILPTENYYIVMTCNNHHFHEIFPKMEEEIPEEVVEKMEEHKDDEDDEYAIEDFESLDYRYYGFEYWSPEHNVFFKPLSYLERHSLIIPKSISKKFKNGYCDKHQVEIVKICGIEEFHCLYCFDEEYGSKDLTKTLEKYKVIEFDRFEIMDLD